MHESQGRSIDEALRRPLSRLFWVERRDGVYRFGDPVSDFSRNDDYEHLTFDIGNNTVLANVGPQGAITCLTIYRDSYRSACHPEAWAGVWLAKDCSSFGPYSYRLEIDGALHDLATVPWDFRTGLLDNIFPITELRDPAGRFTARLLTYAPVSADGAQRLRGIVYGLHLESHLDGVLSGVVHLPAPFADRRQERRGVPWALFDPYEFEFGLGDSGAFAWQVPFRLERGEGAWVPTILYMPGEPTVDEVNARGTPAWLDETWRYFRRLLGRLEIPGNPFLAEFFEREVLQAFLSIAMSGSGKLAGTNWGSYPATRQIWLKDAYYSCLPFMALDPALAQRIITWFDESSVRHPGHIVEGGVTHSLGLSVAGIVLAGCYYDQTGDKEFFLSRPELKDRWIGLLDAVLASRKDDSVWLFPSRYLSDGALDCDYHTGSNVVVWRALMSLARLLDAVFGDAERARTYAAAAQRVRAALLARTVIEGPFGPQYIEGTYRDGRPPPMISDGEESDTTLMPFYGFVPHDDEAYLNYMRFSMTPHNVAYQPRVRALTWSVAPDAPPERRVPATAPGYLKGICSADDPNALFGEQGYYTEVRKVTDADGSLWWWPYGDAPEDGQAPRYGRVVRGRVPGKAGWFAGVHTLVFISRFLGVSYDAPRRVLRVAPHPAVGDFSWADFPIGYDRFSIWYGRSAKRVWAEIHSHTDRAVHVEVVLCWGPPGSMRGVTVNGQPVDTVEATDYLGHGALRIAAEVVPVGAVEIRVAGDR